MQTRNELTIKQISEQLGYHTGTVRRLCEDGKLKAEKRGGKLYIKRYDLRDFLLRRRDKAQSFLRIFSPFRQFEEKIIGPVEKFFGNKPGCVIGLSPGGFPNMLCLYFGLPPGKDINFIFLGEEEIHDRDLIEGRKIVIVDDSTRTGSSIRTIKSRLKGIKNLNLKAIKVAVYDDFAKRADFAVKRQTYDEHLASLKRALEQFAICDKP